MKTVLAIFLCLSLFVVSNFGLRGQTELFTLAFPRS